MRERGKNPDAIFLWPLTEPAVGISRPRIVSTIVTVSGEARPNANGNRPHTMRKTTEPVSR